MKNLLIVFSFITCSVFAQNYSLQYSVQLTAVVDESKPSITIQWPLDANANRYTIYRKLRNSSNWGGAIANFTKDFTSYVDSKIEVGKAYEYRVTRSNLNDGSVASGFIYAGIKYPSNYNKGSILLLIDSRFQSSLKAEIDQYSSDLINEGWNPIRFVVPDAWTVVQIREEIQRTKSVVTDLRTITLIGHVKVPYSGNSAYDGHGDHNGAWPSDTYYGDLNGIWTDNQVDNATPTRNENKNIIGDGKFDQSSIPSDLELEVGRIDFFNLPAFAKTELQLLKDYFAKNHKFRIGLIKAKRQGIVQDNFNFTEAFGQSGVKNFSAFFGPKNVFIGEYRNRLLSESFLWSYGAGGGWYEGAGGISSTQMMATDSLQTVFTFLFGSYFGDWDSGNNFLRSSLGCGTILTAAWAGRPIWAVHHMGLGETIGSDALQSQNNSNLYVPVGVGQRGSHIALLGDPSLVLFPVQPASDLKTTVNTNSISLSWKASPDGNNGYTLLRRKKGDLYFTIIKENLAGLTYMDACIEANQEYEYMLRAVKLETTASGTYYNPSAGIRVSAKSINEGSIAKSEFGLTSDYELIRATEQSTNANSYTWYVNGIVSGTERNLNTKVACITSTPSVCLVARGLCNSDSLCKTINITCSTPKITKFRTSPNITCHGDKTNIILDSIEGAFPFTFQWNNGDTSRSLQNVGAGEYTVQITSRLGTISSQLIEIIEPEELKMDLTITHAKPNKAGSVTINASGGVLPYSYKYVSGFKPDSLAVGEYTIEITDANGCVATKTFRIELNTDISVIDIQELKISPNPVVDKIQFYITQTEALKYYKILSLDGKIVQQGTLSGIINSIGVESLSAAMYILEVQSESRMYRKTFEIIGRK